MPTQAVAVSRAKGNQGPVAASPLTASPVDILIAVDESESITKHPGEITLEQNAARLIALGQFAPESKVGVLGFGGPNEFYNAKSNPQPPVDPVCPMTEVDTIASRDALSDCIGKLHGRKPEQGDRTDFIAAIKDGIADLTGTGDKRRPLLLFLLTDGGIDLVGSPDFTGPTDAVINGKANQDLLTQVVPQAKRADVRIWPLGFGPQVNVRELKKIAAGGALGSCEKSLPDAIPHPIIVKSAADLETALPQIFANASCGNSIPGPHATVRAGVSVDLYVNVPNIVTFGSIEVVRPSQQITVTYFDPAKQQIPAPGELPTGSLAGQSFSLAGTTGPVESLTVDYPMPGRWRIHLVAGPHVSRGSLVSTIVLWKGVLHFHITTHPTDPSPGHVVTVTVELQIGNRRLTASDLAGVHLSVEVSGPGLTARILIPENDNGIPPDKTAHDGIYNGTFTVPTTALGTLTAVGVVTASDVVGDEQSTPITIKTLPRADHHWLLWGLLVAFDLALLALAVWRIRRRGRTHGQGGAPSGAPNPWPRDVGPEPTRQHGPQRRRIGGVPATTMPDPEEGA